MSADVGFSGVRFKECPRKGAAAQFMNEAEGTTTARASHPTLRPAMQEAKIIMLHCCSRSASPAV